MLDSVKLCVAELAVVDKQSQSTVCEFIPIGTTGELRRAGTDEWHELAQLCSLPGVPREHPELAQSRDS